MPRITPRRVHTAIDKVEQNLPALALGSVKMHAVEEITSRAVAVSDRTCGTCTPRITA
jgi:hypothetical protein